MSCHGYRLFQPGIWHSSRTRKISRAWYFSLYLLERVYCDKGAKTATKCEMRCELRIEISIFRMGETFRCASHLFFRNNKTAFQQVECRFSGNPLYQPGIWTPSRTIKLTTNRLSNCINLGFGHLRGLATPVFEADVHCINLGSGHLRRPFLTPEGEALDCINLGSGHLRGPSRSPESRPTNCINLGFGCLRGHIILTLHTTPIVSTWNLVSRRGLHAEL